MSVSPMGLLFGGQHLHAYLIQFAELSTACAAHKKTDIYIYSTGKEWHYTHDRSITSSEAQAQTGWGTMPEPS